MTRAHDCHLCAILGDALSNSPISTVVFSFDASNIISISNDGAIRSWNVRSALESIMGPISMLESILAVDGGKIAWSSVSGDDLTVDGDSNALQPDCLYQIGQKPTCFSMMLNINSVLRVAVGTESGMVFLCDLMEAARHPEPIVTAYYPHCLGEERIEKGADLTADCPACGLCFLLKSLGDLYLMLQIIRQGLADSRCIACFRTRKQPLLLHQARVILVALVRTGSDSE